MIKAYIDGINSSGEITPWVMRRIRLEKDFSKREKNAQIWAVNFAMLTAIVNLIIILRNLPIKLVINVLSFLRIDWLISNAAPFLEIISVLLFGCSLAILNIKKIGGNNK